MGSTSFGHGRLELERDVLAVVADRGAHVEREAVLDDADDRVGDERRLGDLDVEVLDVGQLVDDRQVRALRVVDRDRAAPSACGPAAFFSTARMIARELPCRPGRSASTWRRRGSRARAERVARRCSPCGRGSRRRWPSLKNAPADGVRAAPAGRPRAAVVAAGRRLVLEAVRHVVEVHECRVAGVPACRPGRGSPRPRRAGSCRRPRGSGSRPSRRCRRSARRSFEELRDLVLHLARVLHDEVLAALLLDVGALDLARARWAPTALLTSSISSVAVP